jgi:polysaccharide biosynthesis protein PslJ
MAVAEVIPGPPGVAPAVLGGSRRAEIALWSWVGLAIVLALAAVQRGMEPAFVLVPFVGALTVVAFQNALLSWQTMLGAILLVIVFIPIRRYTIAGGGPVQLEPYRVLIALVFGCWFLALAADPNVKWRATGYGAPITVLWIAILVSLVLNFGRVNAMTSEVLKQVTFFASYFLTMSFIVSVVQTQKQLDRTIRLLVGSGSIMAVCALYEWRTGINLFNGLGRWIPFLQYQDIGAAMIRGAGARALGTAQHPIALGAALVMLLVVLGTIAWQRRDEMMRMLPLALVGLVLIQGAMPGTLASFKFILNPAFMIQEQSGSTGGSGQGRIADLGPSLHEWASGNPFVGQGFGTRMTSQDDASSGAQILDDQWLGTLLTIGAAGVYGLMWLLVRAMRRLSKRARTVTGADAWLATSLTAALMAWTIGLFTYDGFAFIQVTFFAFVMLGFGAVILRDDWES